MRKYGKDTTRIDVRAGERFVLELRAMATAGFKWVLNRPSDVIVLERERIVRGGPGIGGSSMQQFEFAATRAGTATLRMEYKQAWEDVAAERLEIEVLVEP